MCNEPLNKNTAYNICSPAEILSIAENPNDFIQDIKSTQDKNKDYRILSRDSNVLVSYRGFNGTVTKNTKSCTKIERDRYLVVIGSLVSLQRFSKLCVNKYFSNDLLIINRKETKNKKEEKKCSKVFSVNTFNFLEWNI